MKFDLRELMSRATRLTHSSDARGATAVIQAALRRAGLMPTAAGPSAGAPQPGGSAAAAGDGAAHHPRHRTIDPGDVVDVIDLPTRPEAPEPQAPPAARPPQRPGPMLAGHHAGAGGPVGMTGDGSAGGRDYRLFVPPQAGARPLPLVVMLHGCTQNAEDFAIGTAMNEAAQARGFFVLYPEQSARANPQRCWNWFKHSHQQHGRGEPALVAGMVRELMASHAIDPDRVYVAGLSAGGAMAAILGSAYPDLFAAVGVHSGLAAGAATDLPGALAAMRQGGSPGPGGSGHGVPTIVFHGDADATVHPRNGDQVALSSAGGSGAGTTAEPVHAPGRRASTRRLHRAADGRVVAEHWLVHGAAHAWSGGSAGGSYTDPQGPDASAEMLRFFFEHPRRGAR